MQPLGNLQVPLLPVGLSWREALGIVATAFFIISIPIAFNGATGVIYHVPFPVLARVSWGFWGSYVAIISRAILAIFWFAIQTLNGGNTLRVMIGAIWPSFLTLPNGLPADAGITTNGMVSFFLFWLIQLPFLYMHPNNLRWLFLAKSIIVPAGWTAILIWAFVAAGSGPIFAASPTVTGSDYSWAFLSSLTSVIGNYSTLSVNMPDFSRYSRASVKWQLAYVPVLPIVFTFVAFIGIASYGAASSLYGENSQLWDPTVLISQWDSRAAKFFAGFTFALAALGVNISANSLSAANDLAALFPSYINLRRGQLLCAVISWALVPWKILESAGTFLNFMSAYSVFLGPIAAILMVDHWVVHKRKYNTAEMYHPDGIYRFYHGVNYRAIVAFIVGIAPNLPGFVNAINPQINVGVGVRPFTFAWLLGFFASGLTHIVLSWIFPCRESLIPERVGPDDLYLGQRREYGLEGELATADKVGSNQSVQKSKTSWAQRLL